VRILITGATGLIGRELGKALLARGDSLVCLVRDLGAARRQLPFPAACYAWDHTTEVPADAMRDVDAVVHLAGEPVADARWTVAKKALIRDSRVQGTQRLVQAVLTHGARVTAFVQGSASGFYGDRGDDLLTAASARGPGFLADVVRDWEAELRPLAECRPAVRVPVVRTGIVLARQGGALAEMLPMFRLSVAGRLGRGRQWMSWIHLDDIVRLFMHALDSAGSGVLEGVAPTPVTNRQFTTALCRSLGAIENLPIPPSVIRTLYGERALDDLLAPMRGGVWQRTWEQWLPHSADTVWPFFGDGTTSRRSRRHSWPFACLARRVPRSLPAR
jgi:uncharacterized protein